MKVNKNNSNNNVEEYSIDILKHIKTVWADRKLVLKVICIFFVSDGIKFFFTF